MPNSDLRLVVPINVEAFCVNQAIQSERFLPPLTSFQRLPYNGPTSSEEPFLSERAVAQPFASGSLEQGVHLHWALPDALMHGQQIEQKNSGAEPQSARLQFPHLPDRWLVTRTIVSTGETTHWIIDSRFVAQNIDLAVNPGSSAIPWDDPADRGIYEQPPFRYLGRTLELKHWTAPPATSLLSDLNAASLGYIQGPAFYPNCRNVFGMHHTVPAGTPSVEYAYTVCGWYSNPQDDPLHDKSPEQTAETLTDMRWSAPSGAAFAGTLYVGIVHSVRWSDALQPATPATITAAFGNTTSEANAALHDSVAPNAGPGYQKRLHALMTGQLERLLESGGDQVTARQFHQQRFTPASFGSLWYVGRVDNGNDEFATLSDSQKNLLLQLNAAERQKSELRRQAEDLQWQLYADWCKYLKASYSREENLPDESEVRGFITGHSLPDAEAAIAEYERAAGKAKDLQRNLQATLSSSSVKLIEKPQPDCWRPVDPVLLLQGKDVKPAMRFGGDGELACQVYGGRSADALVSALSLPAGAVPDVPVTRLDAEHDTPAFDAPAALGIPKAALHAVMLQALLVSPALAAARLAQRAGKPNARAAIAQWLTEQLDAQTTAPWTGKFPSAKSVNAWSANPWLPIVMHWEIAYQPLATIEPKRAEDSFRPDVVAKNVSNVLDDEEVDLVLKSAPLLKHNDQLASYTGINFITPQAGQRLKKQLKEYRRQQPQSLLASIEPQTQDIPLLSQSLSGFHDRLLLRRQTLQVDVRDPFATSGRRKKLAEDVKATLSRLGSRVTTMAPIVQDRFSPVRGGDFMLRRLWLGDVFGQCREYTFQALSYRPFSNGNRVVTSPALARGDSAGALHPCFPPRLSQAARLDFYWLSASNDAELTGEDAAASPICGWVLPNFLDQSLAIYDHSGDSLGSLQIIGNQLRWLGSPAHPETFTTPIEALLRNSNPHLRDFTLALVHRKDAAQYLNNYLKSLQSVMETIQPQDSAQHTTLPALIGRPLALTRASVRLNLIGPPAVNQTWDAFEHDLQLSSARLRSNAPGPLKRTSNNHEGVNYPVVLGMASDPDDGLVGFYQGGEGEARFQEFFVVAPTRTPTSGITPSEVHTLQMNATQPRRILTMLVDPRAQVVVTTGYAPAQSRTLPPEAVKNAFARMAVTFLTAPILTTEPPPTTADAKVLLPLPLPGQQKGTWKWLRVANDAQGNPHAIVAIAEQSDTGKLVSGKKIYAHEGWLNLTGFQD